MNTKYTENTLHSMIRSHEYIVIVDIEHTCTEDGSIPPDEREIIEIGAVLVETKSLAVIDEYSSLIRPVRHPKVSEFCTQLTGIKQLELDNAESFPHVFKRFVNWLSARSNTLIATWGAYDLVQINIDCAFHNLDEFSPTTALNLKVAFKQAQNLKKPVGLKKALEISFQPFSGNHHRGLNDAKNTAKLLPFIFPKLTKLN